MIDFYDPNYLLDRKEEKDLKDSKDIKDSKDPLRHQKSYHT